MRGIKIHQNRIHKPEKPQEFDGRLVDKAVHISKLEELQHARPAVHCGEKMLENVFMFLYLGTIFAANGLQCYDVDARVTMTMSRCDNLRHIFDSPHLPLQVKLRLYEETVCSLLTYGCETWDLDTVTMRRINGANNTMIARITGHTIPTEVRPHMTSFNLVKKIRSRRLRWVGHIVRTGPESIMYQALVTHQTMGYTGNLLMDSPPHDSIEGLRPIANDRDKWRAIVRKLQSTHDLGFII